MACVVMSMLTTIIVHTYKTIDKELFWMMHHIYMFGDSKYDSFANKQESKPKTKQKNNTQDHV